MPVLQKSYRNLDAEEEIVLRTVAFFVFVFSIQLKMRIFLIFRGHVCVRWLETFKSTRFVLVCRMKTQTD